jgi:predicted nucleic acid-binding protein
VSLIYLDTSVVLAHLLAEDRRPPTVLWERPLVSSRLLEYELWVRLNALRLGSSHGDAARELLGRVAFVELVPVVLARALEPFPLPVRTLDALHLASAAFLRDRGQRLELATYDARMAEAVQRIGIPLFPL